MQNNYRHLNAKDLIDTAGRLATRIKERFPTASLSAVAATVVEVLRDAVARAEQIRRPNWWLRIGLIALALLIGAGAVAVGIQSQGNLLNRTMEFMKNTSGAVVYLGAVVVFLVTLELRFKRRKAVQAVHELRALAHIIDMHQLAKDPDCITPGGQAVLVSGEQMTADSMAHYLNYSTELLALISKVGQLYVQGFPDGTALAAADQFENLATGLSQKIWQKLMILDRFRASAAVSAPVAAPASETEEEEVQAAIRKPR